MPHVVVDYSDNLTGINAKQLLEEINTTLIETELFSPEDIKSRARRDEVFLIGLGVDQAYILVKPIFCREELLNKNSLWVSNY